MFRQINWVVLATVFASPIAAQTTSAASAPAGTFSPAPVAALDAAQRKEVVTAIGTALRQRYIFPDIGEQAASRLEDKAATGAYDSLSDPAAFAARLQADVAEVAHDKHLRVLSMNGPPMPPPGGGAMPRAEAGIVRADKFGGGIGYIEVLGFPAQPAFKPVIDRAMTALAESKALIFDIRRNGGGDPASVAYLTSFLVEPEKPIHLTDIVRRVANTTNFVSNNTLSSPTPVNFAGLPVFVLTSATTFSGGEAFAYDVQALRLGKVIGEVTGGGANPTGMVPLPYGLMAMVPFGRAENPVTKTNWEGRGVQPDVPAPAAEALNSALEQLGQPAVADVASASRQQVFTPRAIPLAGTEAAVRSLVPGLASGNPDYASMSSDFAEMTRQRLPQMQGMLASLGPIRSIEFAGPGDGGDAYDITFAHGRLVVGVILGPDGKIVGSMIRPGAAGG
ncbi:MAG: S41 family peptidase [Candidatus Andeanibacterium colombiense]|uniref:S41 family peptidase n=1 Tax=Candidatus Andeanibacterium colombiense TaxID=3121345 RepID=A0AAJ5X277_9SPHN|nr:MAG: S41 family peptidase [Sphingomonadaceae bacterium]